MKTIKELTQEQISSMSLEELQTNLIKAVEFLNIKGVRGPGRKEDVLNLLKENPMTILEMSEKLDITPKNISSQLTYLRKDGWIIHTDHEQKKYLAQPEPVPVAKEEEETPVETKVRKKDQ